MKILVFSVKIPVFFFKNPSSVQNRTWLLELSASLLAGGTQSKSPPNVNRSNAPWFGADTPFISDSRGAKIPGVTSPILAAVQCQHYI